MTEALLAIADRVVERAQPGEEVEAVVRSERNTDLRVHEGEIEQFAVAEIHGVGIRVIRDGRTGFAWTGSLDPELVDAALHEARDNATFAEPDEFAGLAAADRTVAADVTLQRAGFDEVDPQRKIDLAL